MSLTFVSVFILVHPLQPKLQCHGNSVKGWQRHEKVWMKSWLLYGHHRTLKYKTFSSAQWLERTKRHVPFFLTVNINSKKHSQESYSKEAQLSKQFEIQSKVYFYLFPVVKSGLLATILDKILETIEHFESIFLKIIAVPILSFSPPLGSKVVVSCKATLILERL